MGILQTSIQHALACVTKAFRLDLHQRILSQDTGDKTEGLDEIIGRSPRPEGDPTGNLTEFNNLKGILSKETGGLIYSSRIKSAVVIVAVDITKGTAVESRIYVPGVSDLHVGNTRIVQDETTDLYHLKRIFVEPKFRNLQLGSELLTQTLKCLLRYRQKCILAGTYFLNDLDLAATRHFFEKFRFVVKEQEGILFITRQ